MKEFVKKYYKWLIAMIFIIGVGVVGELIYNMPIRKQVEYQHLETNHVETTGFDFADGVYTSNGGDGIIKLHFDKQFVDKLTYQYCYPTASYIQRYHDVNRPRDFRTMTINVHQEIDSFDIQVPKDMKGILIREIAINNTGNYSEGRFLFWSVAAAMLLLILSIFKEKIVWKAEYIFLTIAMSVGLLMVVNLPAHKIGFDEEIHAGTSLYFFETLARDEQITFSPHMTELLLGESVAWPYHIPQSEEEIKEEKRYWNENLKYNATNASDEFQVAGYKANLSTITYLPQSLMIAVGKFLHLDFTTIFMLGRLGNLLMYCGVIFLAIRHIVIGKRLMLVMSLMPTALFSATTYSYDATVTAFSFLGIAYLITELVDDKEHISYRNCAIFIGALLFASFPKPVYIPMILLALFFKSSKFRDKKEKYIFKAIIVVSFVLMLSTIVLPALTTSSASSLGDARGGDTSVARQLQHVFAAPFEYTKLLLSNIARTFFPYMFGDMGLGGMGHLSRLHCDIPIALLIGYTALTDKAGKKGQKIDKVNRIVIVALSFTVLCLIWTALYLMYTPVGADVINGVQGRYYIPIAMFLALTFSIKDIQSFLKQHIDYAIITTVSLALLMFVVYNQIITRTF